MSDLQKILVVDREGIAIGLSTCAICKDECIQ
jgi:hypothetical protein